MVEGITGGALELETFVTNSDMDFSVANSNNKDRR